MLRTFKYPLLPTAAQAAVLEMWIEGCRQLYNAALQERRDAWKRHGKSITCFDQQKSLTVIRAEDPTFKAIPAQAARSALRRLDKAFANFFRRCGTGEKKFGFPRFRSWGRYDGFDLPAADLPTPVDGRIQLKRGLSIKFHEYRPIKGKILRVSVKKDSCGKWWVCFACRLGDAPTKAVPTSIVGIDLGLTHFLTDSNGKTVENPRLFRKGEALLAERQRKLATKKRGSKSRGRAIRLVAKAHRHIRDQRLDHARKLACELFSKYDVVCHEDLSIVGMTSGRLAKSVHDAAWNLFVGTLACKAESAGKYCIPVDPRGTSQRCSGCGTIVKKDLSVRTHACPSCGLVLDRDHNAALNVLALGTSAVSAFC